uniref:NADH dehydrogenase subunit 3 n=1 Tax=Ixodes confusus TaxID=2932796 RepID=UPI001FF5B0AC|nr:NADH dehydrogenase subunit 3 [Ixodes confusus]UOK09793.1 NADH dehydrogenase subunit 3 [Ixodes confusus]UOK09806.1 NADH dehydrogenase subunit 3 [Ixodes confusus]UOK09819.1 NADH dehydrogenase subunit 3 [Ixodes confusus]UOK09832.1 NADH dehydrogenase subunit 3 [Ixodes confusus]UOK09845.1 NADH dehydrogenase subunit 3 [Ixodes confusus]
MKMIFIFIIPLAITIISMILSKNKFMNKEKLSPFECGFDPFSMSRMSFSLKFFMIAIIFLIFDIEIILILPFPIIFCKKLIYFVSFSIIMIIIMMGLIYEWNKGMLEWMK